MGPIRRGWLLLACAPLLTAQAAPGPVSFDFAGMRFTLPIPKGYCANAALKQQMVSLDTANVTHAVLVSCGGASPVPERIRIATGRSAIAKVLTREAFLKEYRPSFVGPDKFDAGDTLDRAEGMVANALGKRPDLDGKIETLGMDSVCGFLGGNVAVTIGGRVIPTTSAVCITTIGDRMMQITSTGLRGKPEDLERRMRLVEAVALSISAKPIP
jgi:hypothetical protein